MERVDAAQAKAAGERLRLAVEEHPFITETLRLTITASVGLAVHGSGDKDFHGLLRRADQAMYAAKAAGRNRVELAD